MDLLTFIDTNKAFLGTFSIAVATLIAVLISSQHSKRVENRQRKRAQASFASAIAAELIDNALGLIQLYLTLDEPKNTFTQQINGQKNFEFTAYDRLLDRIGDLGTSLSYMLLDTYADIRKLHISLRDMDNKELYDEREGVQEHIQSTLVKTLTSAFVVLLYADYLSGAKFVKEVKTKRIVWIERVMDEFCQYVARIDEEVDFTTAEEKANILFSRRFKNPEDVARMRHMFQTIHAALDRCGGKQIWQAQLIFTALALNIQHTLGYFLNITPNDYDIQAARLHEDYLQ